MIKGLAPADGFITVSGGNTSVPYVNQSTENPMQGMVRVWGTDLQVFSGSQWINMNTSYAQVGISPTYQSALLWAMRKKQEEEELLDAANKHAAVKIALDNFNKAKEQLDVTIILSKEHNESTS